jgi:hypothetical protein
MGYSSTVKVIKSFSAEPEVIRDAVTKAQFYGYRNFSDLIEQLLKKWNEAPERKP